MNESQTKSFFEWKEKHFPELSKKERFETLEDSSAKLAIALANDTFDRLHREKKKNLTKA
ncbi:MAG: hypothetical protein H6970_07215 [Gammaproteobacteria bacterium]|nr:hypothetical protein [Gammaproteobacteria bacterium]MCP5424844.1 hypothetical protein [Gammaproteobacteria bacterium]MCP5458179.1 hypothetical protein [Gammaproteobacteria bacterium]